MNMTNNRPISDEVLDSVFEEIDEMLLDGKFDDADRMLSEFDPETLGIERVLVVLTATLPAKRRLPNRKRFFRRSYQAFSHRKDVELMFIGLE